MGTVGNQVHRDEPQQHINQKIQGGEGAEGVHRSEVIGEQQAQGGRGAAQQGALPGGTAQAARTVTVRTGDTLWALCRTYGLTMRQMLAYNPQIRDPDLIHTGEELRIG